MLTKWWMMFGAAGVLALTACEKKQEATSEPYSEGSVTKPAPPVKEKPKGLKNPDNDADVIALAEAALGCPWRSGQPAITCAEYKEWRKSPLVRKGAADPTLVNLLEDSEAPIRWLGASALKANGKAFRTDPMLAKRVLAAVDAEKDVTVANVLGAAAARINGGRTSLNADIQKIITSHRLPEMRSAAVKDYLVSNRTSANFDFVIDFIRTHDAQKVRVAALKSTWVGTPDDKYIDVCKAWLEFASDANVELAGQAAYHVGFYRNGGGCSAQWDPLLELLATRAADGGFTSSTMSSALRTLHNQKGASPVQRAKTIEIARAVVSNPKNDSASRHSALRFVGETDPKAKKFAATFKDDPEPFVKSTANDILGGLIKLKKPR